MMGDLGLQAYFDRLGIPESGRHLVEKARKNAPVRKPQSRLNNVNTYFPSRKMGRMIATESRTGEYRAALTLEYDQNVLEFYEQPCYLDLHLIGPDGKAHSRIQYPPDFLVLARDQILVWEIRDESRLLELAKKRPHSILKKNGVWRYIEAESHLAAMGILYKLTSLTEFPVLFLANTEFLADYLRPHTPSLSREVENLLKARVLERPAYPLRWLIDEALNQTVEGEAPFKVDEIYRAIAYGILVFDLQRDDLSATSRVNVYRDRAMMELHRELERGPITLSEVRPKVVAIQTGALVDFEGHTYRILMTNRIDAILSDFEDDSRHSKISLEILYESFHSGHLKIVSPPAETESLSERLVSYSPSAIDQALKRKAIIDEADALGGSLKVSKRTLQRYRKAVRQAGPDVLSQHLALAPNHSAKGERKSKLPPETLELIEKIISEYNTPTGINARAAFRKLRSLCGQAMVKICSERTLRKILKMRGSVRLREGNRRAYQVEPAVWYLKADEPIHGVRPFQIVHIDHTEVELELIDPESGKSLGRPWLSLAIDAESRRAIAFHLSFRSPSYRSCMMILRDMVRRFKRLPYMIVVDNGKEFHSHSFIRFCLLYGIKLRYRPPAKARFGSVIERLFGTTQSLLIHQMEGNTKLMHHARSVTKSVMPKNFVAWSFAAFFGALDYHFEHIYGVLPHPAHGEGPVEHFNRRVAETGERLHQMVRYDEFFRIETCPSPERQATRCIDAQRGIKIDHIWYWNNEFRNQNGLELEVRKDPWDPGVAYAFYKDHWVICASRYKYILGDLTEEELRHYLDVLGKRHSICAKDWSPELIADWIKVLDPTAFDSRLAKQQSEARFVYEPLGMTSAAAPKWVASDEPPTSSNLCTQLQLLGCTPGSQVSSVGVPDDQEITIQIQSSEDSYVPYKLI